MLNNQHNQARYFVAHGWRRLSHRYLKREQRRNCIEELQTSTQAHSQSGANSGSYWAGADFQYIPRWSLNEILRAYAWLYRGKPPGRSTVFYNWITLRRKLYRICRQCAVRLSQARLQIKCRTAAACKYAVTQSAGSGLIRGGSRSFY